MTSHQRREWLVEIFVAFNLAFLTVDIYLAHAANDFASVLEWIPIYFSAIVPFLLVPGIVTRRYRSGLGRGLGFFVGVSAIAVGLVGMFLHLESAFFSERTLRSLVYSAPFVAPLAYTGVGFLLLLNRMDNDGWAEWVVFLSLGGFVGNFLLSVFDHAQNGFFDSLEYVPVVAAGLGVGFLAVAIFRTRDRPFLRVTIGVMVLMMLVGVAGFGLHVASDLDAAGHDLTYKFLFGAPVFAPLLFPNIALLAVLGLWDMLAAILPAQESTAMA